MILSSGRKSKKGIGEIQATGEVLTARAGIGFVSQYIERQKWLMEKLQCCERKFIDTAGRIVKTARRTILAIPKIVMEQLSLTEVWQKAAVPA